MNHATEQFYRGFIAKNKKQILLLSALIAMVKGTMNLKQLSNRVKNSIESRHSTDHLADCSQCGLKPKRKWSHSGTMLICDCNIITSRNGGGWGTLEHSWQILQGASTEADELRQNLAEECRKHNMYRAQIRNCLEQLKTNGMKKEIVETMYKISLKLDQESVS